MPDLHAVGVCGFGRCGSTLLMSMLVAGGCPPAGHPDPPYEHDPAAVEGRNLAGRCVKLLHGTRMAVIPHGTPTWRFVWLDRDPHQQARSHVKFLTGFGVDLAPEATAELAASYAQDRPVLLGTLRRVGPVTVLDYERVLAQPRKTARLLRRWVWPGLDVDAATAVVHDRDGACRPDMAVEVSLGEERP
jgi:hypothetical protein